MFSFKVIAVRERIISYRTTITSEAGSLEFVKMLSELFAIQIAIVHQIISYILNIPFWLIKLIWGYYSITTLWGRLLYGRFGWLRTVINCYLFLDFWICPNFLTLRSLWGKISSIWFSLWNRFSQALLLLSSLNILLQIKRNFFNSFFCVFAIFMFYPPIFPPNGQIFSPFDEGKPY